MKQGAAIFIVSLFILGLTFGCNTPQKGALSPETRAELDDLAEANISEHDKYFRLAARLAELLEECAAINSEEKAMERLTEFSTENSLALERLYKELDAWQKHLNDEDRMSFVLQLLAQDFTTKLQSIGPAFRNRIDYNDNWIRQYDRLMANLSWHK